mmetsp:Transcript_15302/g.24858  ORF Transcript_15302/g.24858 Transcript_15302/m.24858 type:complete len:83 (+) Transcript_15302:130-378(+)
MHKIHNNQMGGGVEALPPRGHISGASREMKGIVEEGRRMRVGGGGCRVSATGFCRIFNILGGNGKGSVKLGMPFVGQDRMIV